MARIVYGRLVEQDQVLVGRTAADVKAGIPFAGRFYAGQELNGFQDVALAQQHGQGFQVGHVDLFDAHQRPLHTFFPFFRLDLDLSEHGGVVGKRNVQFLILSEFQVSGNGHITQVSKTEGVLAFRQRQRIEAVFVGNGACSIFCTYGYTDERFAGSGVRECAVYGEFSPVLGKRKAGPTKEGECKSGFHFDK